MLCKIMTVVCAIVLLSSNASISIAAGNETNDSFNKAKKMLERKVYTDYRKTLYCGADYREDKRVIFPDGFTTSAHPKRATRIEWEHAVPAENFGRAFVEWREGHEQCVNKEGKPFKGRRCAEKMNKRYRYMQADMYNLFPAIGAVNAVRGNKQYSELPGVASSFGSCTAKVEGNRFEPPQRAKGAVARAGLYMAENYREYSLSAQQRRLFEAWNRQYPVDQWECTRTKRIEKLQGNENRLVKDACKKAGLW